MTSSDVLKLIKEKQVKFADPHALHDRYTASYFENNRNLALISQAYCIANPKHFAGYSAAAWGLTASDGPKGY